MSTVAERLETEVEYEPSRHFEVVDGEFVENEPMGFREAVAATRMARRMGNHLDQGDLGTVVVEGLFRLDAQGRLKRRPDLAFISAERLPLDQADPEGAALSIPPDLAVEFVSPTNTADEILDKLDEYFAAGVRQAWVVYTTRRLVYIYDSVESVRIIGSAGTLDGGDLLPGFRLSMDDLFGPKKRPVEG